MRRNLIVILLLVTTLSVGWVASDGEESPEETLKNEKPKYVKPLVEGAYYFLETFESNTIGTKWIKSKAKKEDVEEVISKYDGIWAIESSLDSALEGDLGLVLKSKARHHAISSRLSQPFKFTNNKPLVVQYEVKFQNALECGGAYVKLLADEANMKLENFYDKTSFSIMFGPDKCGTETKFHFIVRFKNPVTGKIEEKHAKKSELLDAYFSDGKTHLYTLILRPDNTFKMFIDSTEVNSGSLLNDFTPAINPPKEIVDPNDKKPDTWDDREKIADPDAVKPDDWDEDEPKLISDPNAQKPEGWLEEESETIPDPDAVKPEDWDDSTDGDWEAPKIDNPKCASAAGCGKWTPPQINNPKYKGKWRAPLIDNPNYSGKWEPRKIANPEYFEDADPFKSLLPFSALGLELWSMTDNIYFDNFLITDDENMADRFGKETWLNKKKLELANAGSSDSVIDGLMKAANDKPWLWAIYLLVILLPVVIIGVFCFGKSSPTSQQVRGDAAAQAKKTDAKSEDDQPEADAKADADEELDQPSDAEKKSNKDETEVSEDEKEKSSKEDGEKSDEPSDEKAEEEEKKPAKTTVVKRKARKE